jgi:hypothetical protein
VGNDVPILFRCPADRKENGFRSTVAVEFLHRMLGGFFNDILSRFSHFGSFCQRYSRSTLECILGIERLRLGLFDPTPS